MPRTSSSRSAADRRRLTVHWPPIAVCFAAAIAGVPITRLAAQDSTVATPYARAVASWIPLIAAPGYERLATDRIETAEPGWTMDRAGNLVRRVGEGSPRRVIACGIDETGYVVSAIEDNGFLRVHMDGNGRHVPLWDEFHEGQRVVVAAVDRGNPSNAHYLPGVFAVRSNHLWRKRVADDAPTSIENLWLDIGARSRADAERMGIQLLAPVVRDWPEWTFGDYVAGPAAGARAGCAAIAAAALSNRRAAQGEAIYIISTRKSFDWAGLTGALAAFGHVDSLTIVDPMVGGTETAGHAARAPWLPMAGLDVGTVLGIGVPTRYAGTLAESVREADLRELYRGVGRAAGLDAEIVAPVTLPHGWTAAPPVIIRDSLSRYADVLSKLTDIYAVTGHESPMREAVRALLPAWARDSAVVDTAGNLVLALGPDRDTSVFVAHLDEIGFEVTRIGRDGMVSLRPRGTFFPFLWEGQTALLHRPDDSIPARDGKLGCGAGRGGPLRGVFVPRDSSAQREPSAVTAWFGLDSTQLVAAGVVVGSPLTSYKCSARMGSTRLTARSIDDRAGDTALLLALDDITPSALDHKVIFMWSVREEGGLLGAKAAAAAFGPSVHRVHAVDTFVSADSPLESARFADAPIGDGAAVRALDNSGVTPPDEIERVVRLARASNIPLQVGTTNGGNDGSEFARYGAVDVALAWPLRYSHSPAEVLDLRDLRSLARLVAVVAKAPTRRPRP